MSEFERDIGLHDILIESARQQVRLRFCGPSMSILAEGFVAFVGSDIVAITHKKGGEPQEYVVKSRIVKVQRLEEYQHF